MFFFCFFSYFLRIQKTFSQHPKNKFALVFIYVFFCFLVLFLFVRSLCRFRFRLDADISVCMWVCVWEREYSFNPSVDFFSSYVIFCSFSTLFSVDSMPFRFRYNICCCFFFSSSSLSCCYIPRWPLMWIQTANGKNKEQPQNVETESTHSSKSNAPKEKNITHTEKCYAFFSSSLFDFSVLFRLLLVLDEV